LWALRRARKLSRMRTRFAALFVVATACTFPDITVVVEEQGGAGGTGPGTGGAGGAPVTTSTESTASSMTITSSTSMMSAGGGGAGGGCPDVDGDMDPSILCGGTDCDDDDDGSLVEHEGCCTAPPCDCFDGDNRVHPGQEDWFTEPWDAVDNYDYDCSFSEEQHYTDECENGLLNCNDSKVMVTPTPCGSNGEAITCVGIGLGLCGPGAAEPFSLQQECH